MPRVLQVPSQHPPHNRAGILDVIALIRVAGVVCACEARRHNCMALNCFLDLAGFTATLFALGAFFCVKISRLGTECHLVERTDGATPSLVNKFGDEFLSICVLHITGYCEKPTDQTDAAARNLL